MPFTVTVVTTHSVKCAKVDDIKFASKSHVLVLSSICYQYMTAVDV